MARTGAVSASRFARPVERAAAALALAVAVLVWALTRTYPNYDSYYHLVWGRQLLDGLEPSFEAYAAPTQHPLYVALGALLGLVFGESADRALVLVCLLSHAALVFGTYRLGAAVFGRWSGRAGGAVRGRERVVPALRRARVRRRAVPRARGLGGRAARPRRGRGAAGAARRSPGCCGPRRGCSRAALAVLRAALGSAYGSRSRWSPRRVIWALTDLVGHRRPAALAARDLRARRRPRPRARPRARARLVRVVRRRHRAPAGRAAGARRRRARRARARLAALRVPLALFAAGVITFVGTGVLGLSILPRYLTVPAVALCLFAGYALLGFTALEREHAWRVAGRAARRRRPWSARSAASILAPSLTNVREELRFIRATHDSLIALLDDPAVRDGDALRDADVPDLPARARRALASPGRPDRRRARRSGATAASRSSCSARRRCAATASPPAPRRRSTCRVDGLRARSRGMAF